MSASAHIARAKRHGVAFERFPDREVFEASNYVCECGCGLPCDRTKKPPNAAAPTLGHIIALSCGGTHTRDNVRTERWGCNERLNHERDTPRAAKIKRQRRETGQQARRDRRKAEGLPPLIRNRGFDKSKSKRFDGTVVSRDR